LAGLAYIEHSSTQVRQEEIALPPTCLTALWPSIVKFFLPKREKVALWSALHAKKRRVSMRSLRQEGPKGEDLHAKKVPEMKIHAMRTS
jgi:hypothetical protein